MNEQAKVTEPMARPKSSKSKHSISLNASPATGQLQQQQHTRPLMSISMGNNLPIVGASSHRSGAKKSINAKNADHQNATNLAAAAASGLALKSTPSKQQQSKQPVQGQLRHNNQSAPSFKQFSPNNKNERMNNSYSFSGSSHSANSSPLKPTTSYANQSSNVSYSNYGNNVSFPTTPKNAAGSYQRQMRANALSLGAKYSRSVTFQLGSSPQPIHKSNILISQAAVAAALLVQTQSAGEESDSSTSSHSSHTSSDSATAVPNPFGSARGKYQDPPPIDILPMPPMQWTTSSGASSPNASPTASLDNLAAISSASSLDRFYLTLKLQPSQLVTCNA